MPMTHCYFVIHPDIGLAAVQHRLNHSRPGLVFNIPLLKDKWTVHSNVPSKGDTSLHRFRDRFRIRFRMNVIESQTQTTMLCCETRWKVDSDVCLHCKQLNLRSKVHCQIEIGLHLKPINKCCHHTMLCSSLL